MKSSTLAIVCLALGLSGCASMSKDECLTVDWRTVGYEDGAAGRSGDAIGRHRKACADHGVAPDLGAYQVGRTEGLSEFCQPENGFRIGANGGAYGGACPAELAPAFTAAYEAGRELHLRESRVDDTIARLESAHRELEHVERELTNIGVWAISRESTSEERAQALLDTRELAERRQQLKSRISQLERDQRRYERELADYRAQVAQS